MDLHGADRDNRAGDVYKRQLVNLVYGRQKHLKKIHIGKIWRPDPPKKVAGTGSAGK